MTDDSDDSDDSAVSEEFWDRLYAHYGRSEQGPVNRHLVSEVEQLTSGSALDLGCADGADAIWLAQHGWQVTGVDVSGIALDRARAHAARLGYAERVTLEQHDLAVSFPDGTFDLVSAQFLHSPVAGPGERKRILRRAAAAVAPGGHLVVVSHQGMPAWHQGMPDELTEHPLDLTVPTPEENLAALNLAGEWEAVRVETVAAEVTSPTGEPGIRHDHVLHFHRRGPEQ